ncbi:MAG TPA: RNA polymerase sigma factor [Myxococcales bacterium]|nr:RNA polymerase sigma factor [Myxococcales bacterium]
MTDEELMVAYAAGDRRSFAALFGRWAPRLHGFFLRALGEPAAADDLLQVTFLNVHRARRKFRPLLSLRSWLFSIAAHALQDELRRRKRLPLAPEKQQAAVADTLVAEEEPVSVESRQRARAVRGALERLPESQRAVLYLHRFEQMSFAEIARVLGTSEGAVKLRAFRAYERLRRELLPLLQEDDAA